MFNAVLQQQFWNVRHYAHGVGEAESSVRRTFQGLLDLHEPTVTYTFVPSPCIAPGP